MTALTPRTAPDLMGRWAGRGGGREGGWAGRGREWRADVARTWWICRREWRVKQIEIRIWVRESVLVTGVVRSVTIKIKGNVP
jgi:hypothetical protein